MNGQDRFEADLRGWLHDQAPRSAPEGLVPTGMSAVRGIPQRRTLAWFFATPPVVRVLAAGVVVAGVLAAALLLDVLPSTAPPGASPTPTAVPSPTITCTLPSGCGEIVPTITDAVTDVGYPIRSVDIGSGWFCYADPFHPVPCPSQALYGHDVLGEAEVTFWGSPLHAFFVIGTRADGSIGYEMKVLPEPGSTLPPVSPSASPSASEPVGQPGFTTNAPPAADATWTSITWTRLAQDDVRTQVARVVRWSGGYIALGQEVLDSGLNMRTPAWISADGVTWAPLRPSVFGFSTVIVDVVEVPTGLVAITATSPSCQSTPCPSIRGVLASWTSTDGRTWTPHPGPGLIADGVDEQPPVVASGPGGIVVAEEHGGGPSRTTSTQAAVSADGLRWTMLGADAFPTGFGVSALWGRSDGYAAIGTVPIDANEHFAGSVLWSSDGLTWVVVAGSPQLASGGIRLVSTGPTWGMTSAEFGRDGAIAVGNAFGAPSPTFWWQSSDGRHWHQLQEYPPIGPWPGPGEGMLGSPDGWLASDGTRLVGLRLRTDPTAWVSFDGARWSTVQMSGEVPASESAKQGAGTVTVLPGGLLYTDNGGNWWYGAASAG